MAVTATFETGTVPPSGYTAAYNPAHPSTWDTMVTLAYTNVAHLRLLDPDTAVWSLDKNLKRVFSRRMIQKYEPF